MPIFNCVAFSSEGILNNETSQEILEDLIEVIEDGEIDSIETYRLGVLFDLLEEEGFDVVGIANGGYRELHH